MRRIVAVLFAIVIGFAAPAVALVPPALCPGPACVVIPPTEVGDGETVVYEDEEFLVVGTIVILSGGQVVMRNASFLFMPTSEGVRVEGGGALEIANATLAHDELAPLADRFALRALAGSSFHLHNASVSGASVIDVQTAAATMVDDAFEGLEEGVEIGPGGSARIARSAFSGMETGIRVVSGDLLVENSRFTNVGTLVDAEASIVRFEDNEAAHPTTGVRALGSALAIHRNFLDEDGGPPTVGVDAQEGSTGVISFNTFRDWGTAIRISDSDVEVSNNLILSSIDGLDLHHGGATSNVLVADNVFDVSGNAMVLTPANGRVVIARNEVTAGTWAFNVFTTGDIEMDDNVAHSGGTSLQGWSVNVTGNDLTGQVIGDAANLFAHGNNIKDALVTWRPAWDQPAQIENNTYESSFVEVIAAFAASPGGIVANETLTGSTLRIAIPGTSVSNVSASSSLLWVQADDIFVNDSTFDVAPCIALDIKGSRARLRDVVVTGTGPLANFCGTERAAIVVSGGEASVLRAVRVEGTVRGHAILFAGTSGNLVEESVVRNNAFDGIVSRDATSLSGGVAVHTSSLHDNGLGGYDGRAVWNKDAGATMDLEGNWWGDASGPAHSTNPSGLGDRVEGSADVTPWLASPP